MILEHHVGCADADGAGGAGADFVADRLEIIEERLDEAIEPIPGGAEAEGAS